MIVDQSRCESWIILIEHQLSVMGLMECINWLAGLMEQVYLLEELKGTKKRGA
jgi:hypothetical protein